LFLFDEPTPGLHFDDIRLLLEALQKLVSRGHTVLVIEHNPEVIRRADRVVDLGPEGGAGGGEVLVAGSLAAVAACEASYTGAMLRQMRRGPTAA
jgi:excinuclease ABC subunit A